MFTKIKNGLLGHFFTCFSLFCLCLFTGCENKKQRAAEEAQIAAEEARRAAEAEADRMRELAEQALKTVDQVKMLNTVLIVLVIAALLVGVWIGNRAINAYKEKNKDKNTEG